MKRGSAIGVRGKANTASVSILDKRLNKYPQNIKSTAIKALNLSGAIGAHVDIYLVGAAQMEKLNEEYLGKSSPTNVISVGFPKDFPSERGGVRQLGEIYLCPPYMHARREDVRFMLVHGILHLLGFNHSGKSDRIDMEKREDYIAQCLNINY